MQRYDDNQETQFAYGEMFNYDFEMMELPGKEYFDSLDDCSLFVDCVKERAVSVGYCEDTDLVSFLVDLCKKADVTLSRTTLTNWMTKGNPATGDSGRENVYKLCFALQMNAEQTGEFFLKAYLERPFNYKNLHEAIYFFCMNNGLGYRDAGRIIEKAELLPVVENPYAQDITEEIGRELQTFHSEEMLLEYLHTNRCGFTEQNKTATERIQSLIEKCCPLAAAEFDFQKKAKDKAYTVDNEDELLSVIYNYNARATNGYWEKNGKLVPKPVYAKSISESNFPQLVRCNFPQRQQLENIKKHKASYDAIRKALIMLSFYHFFADARCKGAKSPDLFDEFVDEMNTTLAECGYVQLYWRNPYDWMIGHCAEKEEPLDMLRNMIDEYYLNDPTILNP
jgi:hypothetical protein